MSTTTNSVTYYLPLYGRQKWQLLASLWSVQSIAHPAELPHLSMLRLSLVFLCWEATTALWQWRHCVIKLCVVLHSSVPPSSPSSSDPSPSHTQPSASLSASWYRSPLSSSALPSLSLSLCSVPLSLSSSIFYSMSHDSIHICLLFAWTPTEFLSEASEGRAAGNTALYEFSCT